MDQRSLDKAMDIFAHLITGETISKTSHADLYEAYNNQAEVYDILDAVLKKSNLHLYEYKNALYVTAGYQNRVFGFTNEELKKAIGLRLNKELFLAYVVIYATMTLFYENTSQEAALSCVKAETVIEATGSLLTGVMKHMPSIAQNEQEENSFRTLALLWDEMPLVTENEDPSTLKAARGSKTGFVKLVYNFLISQSLFAEAGGNYYITDRMRAMIENYYDSCKGRLYEMMTQGQMSDEREEEQNAAY